MAAVMAMLNKSEIKSKYVNYKYKMGIFALVTKYSLKLLL